MGAQGLCAGRNDPAARDVIPRRPPLEIHASSRTPPSWARRSWMTRALEPRLQPRQVHLSPRSAGPRAQSCSCARGPTFPVPTKPAGGWTALRVPASDLPRAYSLSPMEASHEPRSSPTAALTPDCRPGILAHVRVQSSAGSVFEAQGLLLKFREPFLGLGDCKPVDVARVARSGPLRDLRPRNEELFCLPHDVAQLLGEGCALCSCALPAWSVSPGKSSTGSQGSGSVNRVGRGEHPPQRYPVPGKGPKKVWESPTAPGKLTSEWPILHRRRRHGRSRALPAASSLLSPKVFVSLAARGRPCHRGAVLACWEQPSTPKVKQSKRDSRNHLHGQLHIRTLRRKSG